MINFKNALIYRLSGGIDLSKLEEQLAVFAFTPCGSQDMAKAGWIPPLGEVLTHTANGMTLLVVQREEKILPAAVIKKELDGKVAKLEAEQHRRLKKTEKDSLKDEVIQTLIPRAFSRYHKTQIWINEGAGLIIVDTASAKRAEDALAFLRKTLGSLPVVPLAMESPVEMTLTNWVRSSHAPTWFKLQDEAELKAVLEEGGIIRCKHQDLCGDEIGMNIRAGKLVTKLALEWRERISFVLTDSCSLKKLEFSSQLLDQNDDIDRDDYAARFDADFVLMTGELAALIAYLIEVLGGEMEHGTDAKETVVDSADDTEQDDLYPKAVEFVQRVGRASISGVQREFRIGYNRAARIIEQMEYGGVVSAPAHDGSRTVLSGGGAQ
ncbi:recombination associated protein [Chania multitudinisentens RB-25]|uniref:Recombination-associated protein RdgC n=2 Tax=Chania TaxID=1745211 RepID=W0LIJ4_9GAMM|nr:recombination associated protein [Chania multitudinisentens RB-25]